MKIGSQIIRVRNKKGDNQKKFASILGLSQVHFNAIENDRRPTTIKMLEKIATATNTQLIITFIDKE